MLFFLLWWSKFVFRIQMNLITDFFFVPDSSADHLHDSWKSTVEDVTAFHSMSTLKEMVEYNITEASLQIQGSLNSMWGIAHSSACAPVWQYNVCALIIKHKFVLHGQRPSQGTGLFCYGIRACVCSVSFRHRKGGQFSRSLHSDLQRVQTWLLG